MTLCFCITLSHFSFAGSFSGNAAGSSTLTDKAHQSAINLTRPVKKAERVTSENTVQLAQKKSVFIVDGTRPNHINRDFSIEYLKDCDILLVATFSKANGSDTHLIVNEIIKDKTKAIKIGDYLSPYTFQGVRKKPALGALFCRKTHHDFLNFIDKNARLSFDEGERSLDDIRRVVDDAQANLPYTTKNKQKQRQFHINKPYHINRSFFIEDIDACEILLEVNFSAQRGNNQLVISAIIRDETHTLSIGDILVAVPFRDMLDSAFTRAIFCRRHHSDFLNFFTPAGLTEPDDISLTEIKRRAQKTNNRQ